MTTFDVVVIGGGIVGCATALHLARRNLRVAVLEKESEIAAHQTGHNSGVVHAGLYYKPGSLKARTCIEGREALVAFCETNAIPLDRCGKLVVATSKAELARLDELERRGKANGLTGIRRLEKSELREHEPYVAGIAGLHVGETGIVDYRRVTSAYVAEAQSHGAEIRLGHEVTAIRDDGTEIVVETTSDPLCARCVVGCAGLASDRVAKMAGLDPGVRIVPFRGDYYAIIESRRNLVRNLIYPVPDPSFPFLGVHFTRRIGGEIEAGPNAVLSLKREGYTKTAFSLRDAVDTIGFPGMWRLAAKHWQTGFGEVWRAMNKRAFVEALQNLVPDIREGDLVPAGAGVRAQAMRADGSLVDDFHFVEKKRMVHVLNAPSPAATASLAIGKTIAERVALQL